MDKLFYEEYYTLEREHWWFRCRLEILEMLISKYSAKLEQPLKILNVGVATGATSEMLGQFGEVTSVEYDEDCCKFLIDKVGITPVHASFTELPFDDNSYDIICAFDVIEHIAEDQKACLELHRTLKKGGLYLVTVPAFMFLWSNHDVVNHHERRYTLKGLKKIISNSGLEISHTGFFNFWLFVPIARVRLLQKLIPKGKADSQSGSDFEVMNGSSVLNSLLYGVFKTEFYLMKIGVRLPFGISVWVGGTKR